MTCGDVLDRIELWTEGLLSKGEAEALERHCDVCSSCAGQSALAGRIDAELRRMAPERAGDLAPAVLARLAPEPRTWELSLGSGLALALCALAAVFRSELLSVRLPGMSGLWPAWPEASQAIQSAAAIPLSAWRTAGEAPASAWGLAVLLLAAAVVMARRGFPDRRVHGLGEALVER